MAIKSSSQNKLYSQTDLGINPSSVTSYEDSGKFINLCESESGSVLSYSFPSHGLYSLWNAPGQNTGVGSLSLLQGIFPTQGSNPGLPHYRQILYQLNHKGSPRIAEWVAYLFSRWSSWPRNQTRVSCIADRFFTNRAFREAPINLHLYTPPLSLL